MKTKNKSMRKKLIFGLAFALIFNFTCLSLWSNLYLRPSAVDFFKSLSSLNTKIISKDYNDLNSLVEELKNNNVDYVIYDLNNEKIAESNQEHKDYLFMSELINVNGENYLVKGYAKNTFDSSRLFFNFIKIQLVLWLIAVLFLYLFSSKGIINPIEKLIDDIKNYKYGKKPIRNKIITDIDVVQNEFVNLTEDLDKNNEEKNKIIASISHDIKTPLTSIIGYSDLLSEEKDIKEIKKYNEIINLKAKNIKSIVNNFDEYLINDNNSQIKIQTINIKELIEQLKSDYNKELELNGIDFIINSNCDNEMINLNIEKIKRVFSNIISNSVKYIGKDGKIIIDITKNKNKINFKISDNGKGVDTKIINKIFEPFYTTDNSRKNSGLGLSIVKEIILYHNGDVKAYNNKIGGLTIEFNLPKDLN